VELGALAKRLIMDEAFGLETDAQVYLDGTSNILSSADMDDRDQIRSLAHLLDEKRLLGEVLTRDMTDARGDARWPGLQVKIGDEIAAPHLNNFSLISSTYTIHGKTVGVLGIIGPKRMEYSRMMSLVGYMSKVVSDALNKMAGSDKELPEP
jgi:heat-inducible transcriptional repressor